MNVPINRYSLSRAASTISLALLCGLTGCQNRKVVARVNGNPIYGDALEEQALTQAQILPSGDAGGTTLFYMIRDELIDQLAKQHHAVPSDASLESLGHWFLEMTPEAALRQQSGNVPTPSMLHQFKVSIEQFAIGTNFASVDPATLNDTYIEYKDRYTVPPAYRLRIMKVHSPKIDQGLMDQLRTTGDFHGIASKLGEPQQEIDYAGSEVRMPEMEVSSSPALKAALDKLKPGDFTPQPIVIDLNQQPGTPAVPAELIIQLIAKVPAYVPSIDEIRPLLVQTALQKTDPPATWQAHYVTVFTAWAQHSEIEILIDRYKYLKAMLTSPVAAAPTPQSGGRPSPNGQSAGHNGQSTGPNDGSTPPNSAPSQ